MFQRVALLYLFTPSLLIGKEVLLVTINSPCTGNLQPNSMFSAASNNGINGSFGILHKKKAIPKN
ncbi:hypothetical protein [Neobacillus sp. GCM10023253]|uniref:hypothetical protein n=1 Tax=Neobacillus sp. GCM10023253 TaxID=3252644 RepID=UPI00366FAADA